MSWRNFFNLLRPYLIKGVELPPLRFSWITLVILAAGVAFFRLGQHADYFPLFNFTPYGALALFGGACFSRQGQAYALTVGSLFMGDLLLSYTLYTEFNTGFLYPGFYWTYLAFALMVLVSKAFFKYLSLGSLVLGGLGVALVHWLITDIGPCIGIREMMGHGEGISGILACYASAIPWSARFLYSTWVFAPLFFLSYALFSLWVPAWQKLKK